MHKYPIFIPIQPDVIRFGPFGSKYNNGFKNFERKRFLKLIRYIIIIDIIPSLTVKNEKKSRFPHNYAEFGTLFNCMIARYTTYFFVPAKIFFMFFSDTTSFDVQNPNAS